MSNMQKFYEDEIAFDQPSPYHLLAEVTPEESLTDDLLEWFPW